MWLPTDRTGRNCSSGTCTPGRAPQMFEWNMLSCRSPADVQVEHVHLPAYSKCSWEHVRLSVPPDVRMEHVHLPQSLKKRSSGTCTPDSSSRCSSGTYTLAGPSKCSCGTCTPDSSSRCSNGTCTPAAVHPNVRVEHLRLAGPRRCSSGTCSLAGLLQMFKWNMYT